MEINKSVTKNNSELFVSLQLLWEHRKIIILIYTFLTVLTLLIGKIITPQYKVTASLFIVNPKDILPDELVIILHEYFLKKSFDSRDYVLQDPAIKNIKKLHLIRLSFRTKAPNVAAKTLRNDINDIINKKINKLIDIKYTYKMYEINNTIKYINIEIDNIEKYISNNKYTLINLERSYNLLKQNELKLGNASKQDMLPGLILVQNEIFSLQHHIYNQTLRIISDKMAMEGLKKEREKILNLRREFLIWISPPYVSEKPIRPHILIYLFMSWISASFLSIFVIFMLENWKKRKKENDLQI